MHNNINYSMHWKRYYTYSVSTLYPRLYIPSERKPRILDPANPTNNVYIKLG